MKQELEDSEPNREAQLLYGNEGGYGIYQLKDSAETRDIRFMDMDYLEKEGIPVRKILKKNPNIAMIRDYVRSAINQVDGSLQMTRCDIATEGRVLKINFTVSGASGQTTAEMEV